MMPRVERPLVQTAALGAVELSERLAAANNVLCAAQAAVDAAMMALTNTDSLGTEAQAACRAFQERIGRYKRTNR